MYEIARQRDLMKNRYVAVFFAFFGGILGLHKMYLRGFNAGSGRLVFFFLALFLRWPIVLVILAVVAIVEGILMAGMDPAAFDAKYNKGQPAGSMPDKTSRKAGRPAARPVAIFSRASKWIKSGTKKFREMDMQGALADFLQALERAPANPVVHFNLACTYSMLEDVERGFYHLEQAVACGFRETEKIAGHDSLAFLRIQPGFAAFVAAGYKRTDAPALQAGDDGSLLDSLRRITEARQRGEISEADFAALKEKLMR